MRKVFVHTNAFVALRNRSEREHAAARRVFRELLSERVSLLTSNFVFSETYTALLVRVGRDEAIRWGRAFRAGEAVELVRVDEEVEEEAWSILESHADKAWSYVDATSFALMRREGVDEAFTFDRDFLQRGLLVIPPP
jgi:predicted nucleic acid-binding protein